MMKENKLIDWEDHIDKKYGSAGSPAREKYEQEFQAFLSHILIPIEKNKRNELSTIAVDYPRHYGNS